MKVLPFRRGPLLLGALLTLGAATAAAAEIGQIKSSKGQVSVERKGQALPGEVVKGKVAAAK